MLIKLARVQFRMIAPREIFSDELGRLVRDQSRTCGVMPPGLTPPMRAAAPLLGVRQAARMSFARQTLQRIAQQHNFAKNHLVLRERHKEDVVRFRTAPGDVAGMMLFALENFDVERILISRAERGIRSREKVEGSGRAGVRAPAEEGRRSAEKMREHA